MIDIKDIISKTAFEYIEKNNIHLKDYQKAAISYDYYCMFPDRIEDIKDYMKNIAKSTNDEELKRQLYKFVDKFEDDNSEDEWFFEKYLGFPSIFKKGDILKSIYINDKNYYIVSDIFNDEDKKYYEEFHDKIQLDGIHVELLDTNTYEFEIPDINVCQLFYERYIPTTNNPLDALLYNIQYSIQGSYIDKKNGYFTIISELLRYLKEPTEDNITYLIEPYVDPDKYK